MPAVACLCFYTKSKLRGLVLVMTRTRGKTAHFLIDAAGHPEESNTKKDNSGPTQQHENP